MSTSDLGSFFEANARLAEVASRLVASDPGAVTTTTALRDLTSLRIGGPVGLVCRVDNAEQARKFQAAAASADVPYTCLGGGSNVLGDDRGYPGVILRIATSDHHVHHETVRVGAGLDVDALVARTLDAGLVGLEFASGLPGTVGGAVVGNAGCYGHEIGEFVLEATVLTRDGRLVTYGPADFGFGYRTSVLKNGEAIVLDVLLQLRRGDPAPARRRREELIADRRRKHPVTEPTAGSWFKNLPPAVPGGRREPAGALLDAVGARGMREGGAAVFAKHANIIINAGGATSADVLRLASRMHDAVLQRFGVDLDPEVRHLVPGASTTSPPITD